MGGRPSTASGSTAFQWLDPGPISRVGAGDVSRGPSLRAVRDGVSGRSRRVGVGQTRINNLNTTPALPPPSFCVHRLRIQTRDERSRQGLGLHSRRSARNRVSLDLARLSWHVAGVDAADDQLPYKDPLASRRNWSDVYGHCSGARISAAGCNADRAPKPPNDVSTAIARSSSRSVGTRCWKTCTPNGLMLMDFDEHRVHRAVGGVQDRLMQYIWGS
jgi:hypothetical protein